MPASLQAFRYTASTTTSHLLHTQYVYSDGIYKKKYEGGIVLYIIYAHTAQPNKNKRSQRKCEEKLEPFNFSLQRAAKSNKNTHFSYHNNIKL